MPLNPETIVSTAIIDGAEVLPAVPTLLQELENIGGHSGTGILARLSALEAFVESAASVITGLFPAESGVQKVAATATAVATLAQQEQAKLIPTIAAGGTAK